MQAYANSSDDVIRIMLMMVHVGENNTLQIIYFRHYIRILCASDSRGMHDNSGSLQEELEWTCDYSV